MARQPLRRSARASSLCGGAVRFVLVPSGVCACAALSRAQTLGRSGPRGLAPKSDNETMCWLENKQLLAAPASRRLGRAGLEAPPLRGQKMLSC